MISKNIQESLNPIKVLYYIPENRKIVEIIHYSKATDGPTKEI